jgi:hypothetical protein
VHAAKNGRQSLADSPEVAAGEETLGVELL